MCFFKASLCKNDCITLGKLEAKRDWGYAPDYVEAMWMMLQQENPDDYIVATGSCYSIKDFLNEAFSVAGISDWSSYIKQDQRFMRPAEVDVLVGDNSKARENLGWKPRTSFRDLVKIMVENDINSLK